MSLVAFCWRRMAIDFQSMDVDASRCWALRVRELDELTPGVVRLVRKKKRGKIASTFTNHLARNA